MNKIDVLCFGELLLDMVARENAQGDTDGFDMKPGGAAGNVAVAASRMGIKAGVIAKVSGDYFGAYLKQVMQENSVDTTGMIMDPDRKIALAFVTFDAAKKPTYLFYRENSASASLSEEEIDSELVRKAKVLYFSSIGLVRDPLRKANYQVAKIASENGVRVAFDPNIRFGVWPSREAARQEILHMMEYTSICKMNDEELAFLFGEGDLEEKCAGILSAYKNLELLTITLGSDGAFIMDRNGKSARVGVLDNDVVDTVGAGDSFFATLITMAIQNGFSFDAEEKLREALQYANSAALLTAKRPGAIPAMPFLNEVETLRAKYNLAN